METAMVYLAYTTQLILVNHFYFPGKISVQVQQAYTSLPDHTRSY